MSARKLLQFHGVLVAPGPATGILPQPNGETLELVGVMLSTDEPGIVKIGIASSITLQILSRHMIKDDTPSVLSGIPKIPGVAGEGIDIIVLNLLGGNEVYVDLYAYVS